MLPQSLWVQVCTTPFDLDDLLSWCFLSPLVLWLFLPIFHRVFLSPERSDLRRNFLQGWEFQVLSLYIVNCGSPRLFSSAAGGSLSEDAWWRHTSMRIAECLRFYFRAVVFSSLLGLWPVYSVLGHSSTVTHGFHLMEWGIHEIRFSWLPPQVLFLCCPKVFCRRDII